MLETLQTRWIYQPLNAYHITGKKIGRIIRTTGQKNKPVVFFSEHLSKTFQTKPYFVLTIT
jgi:hypothetical protein